MTAIVRDVARTQSPHGKSGHLGDLGRGGKGGAGLVPSAKGKKGEKKIYFPQDYLNSKRTFYRIQKGK